MQYRLVKKVRLVEVANSQASDGGMSKEGGMNEL